MLPKIVVYEEQDQWMRLLRQSLDREAQLIWAVNLTELREHFLQHADLAMIVVSVDRDPQQLAATCELVKWLAKKFRGPMLAAAYDAEQNDALMRSGCNHSVVTAKTNTPTIIRHILGLRGAPVG